MSRLYKWGEMKMNVGVMSSNFDFGNHVGISCLLLLRALIGLDDLISAVSCYRFRDGPWMFFVFRMICVIEEFTNVQMT